MRSTSIAHLPKAASASSASSADLLALLHILDEPQLLNEYGRQQIG